MRISPALAYGCRYSAPPLKHLLTFTLLRRHRPTHSTPLLPTTLSLSSQFPNPNFLSGNCPFFRMEWFWAGSGINKNKVMVEHLKTYGVITSEKVTMPLFLPHMHAMCLQLLEENLQPNMHALDVGSGTGYLTACFALMVGPQGRVVGMEHIPELVSSSIPNIQSAAAPLLKEGSLSVHAGDGRLGWPEHAPYDAIHVGAAAPEMLQALIDQLKPGGRMVIPVGSIFQD